MSARLPRTALAVLCALTGLGLAACKESPRDPAQWPIGMDTLASHTPALEPGEAAYRRTCVSCHGVDGKGNGMRTGADFTSPTGPLTSPDAVLLTSIRDGKTGAIGTMPAHGRLLSVSEQTTVLAYVRRTFGAGIVVVDPTRDAGVDAGP